MSRLIIVVGLIFFSLGLTGNYFDINLHISGSQGVTQIGQMWYYLAPESLQTAEVIVSRYIDPCSSLEILNCSGFLWHPIISSILTLPAGLSFSILAVLLIFLGFKKRKRLSKINKG